MKASFNCILFLTSLLGIGLCEAQVGNNQSYLSDPTPYSIVTNSANSRVWERTVYVQGVDGQIVAQTNSYTELATGLNHQDPTTGQWVPSKEEIDILPDGTGAGTNGQHQVFFPPNLYNGQIMMVTPDGEILRSQPVALSYDDGSNTVLIAVLTNSVGELVASNQVIYPAAFDGLNADLSYTYRKGGFEQDVVLHDQPPSPESFGMNPTNTTLQVLTEFFNPPAPQIKMHATRKKHRFNDATLRFGKTIMGRGKAFLFGDQSNGGGPARREATVYKNWVQIQGRTFLVEEVPLLSTLPELQTLPMTSRSSDPSDPLLCKISPNHLLPAAHAGQPDSGRILLASRAAKLSPGFVLDYNLIDSDQENITFETGSTYLISAPVNLGNGLEEGNSVNFESGSVIKFTADASTGLNYDPEDASYPGSPDEPVVFTSVDDDSVGAIISGSTGNPVILTNVYYLCNIESGLQNLNFYYAGCAVDGSDPTSIFNCQFYNCGQAVQMGASGELDLDNDLFSGCPNPVTYGGDLVDDWSEIDLNVQNVTADSGIAFESDPGVWNYYIYYVNCLMTRISVSYDFVDGFGCNSYWQNDASCYETAGRADFYLAAGSVYHGAAATNLDELLNDSLPAQLATMTTYAPQDGGWPDTNAVDAGYHYPTNEDSYYTGIPDWWEWKWYGTYGLSASTPDGNGNTLLYDYQHNINPYTPPTNPNPPLNTSGAVTFTNGMTIRVFDPKPTSNVP